MPPPALRFTEHKQITNPVPLIFIIESLNTACARAQRLTSLFNQLFARFIEADDRTFFIVIFRVQVQHVFHTSDELGIHLSDAPLLFQPRL
jgi:hypothetical protein